MCVYPGRRANGRSERYTSTSECKNKSTPELLAFRNFITHSSLSAPSRPNILNARNSHQFLMAAETQPPVQSSSTTDSPSTTVQTQTQEALSQRYSSSSTLAPVPDELRGSELTFKETGYEKTFLFAKNNTFIQMDGDTIQTFQLR